MDNIQQPSPGTSAYFPSLVNRIRNVHPDLPLDTVILQSILLCLVATPPGGSDIGYSGQKSLVLRTKEEDIGIVLSLAYLVLTKVFGTVTTKHKVKKDHGRSLGLSETTHIQEFPDDLIRDCFLRGKPGTRLPSAGFKQHHRDRSRKSGSLNGARPSSNIPSASSTIAEASLTSSLPSRDSDSLRNAPSRMSSLRIRPRTSRVETEPVRIQTRPRLDAHAISEPPSAVSASTMSPVIMIPGALVVSGLEHTTLPAQRALLRVLHERKIVLDGEQPNNAWKLPPDFIIVYVCPMNAYDRPPILRTLLDHFGMSADINISHALRQAYLTYQSATSPLSSSFQSLATPRSPLSPLWSSDSIPPPPSPRLRGSPLHPGNHQHTTSIPPAPIITPQELSHLRTLTLPVPPSLRQTSVTHNSNEAYTSIHPTLNVYLQDLFAAARHHPMVDGSLLTLRAHHDAEDMVRAFRVVCGDSVGADLVSAVAASSTANGYVRHSEETSSTTEDASSGLGWDKTEDEWLGAELEMGRQKASSVRSVRIRVNDDDDEEHRLTPGHQTHLFDDRSEMNGSRTDLLASLPRQPQVWDVSEADIGKVFPRVVSHRLRMRAGLDDEVLSGAMFPAAAANVGEGGRQTDGGRGPEDKTVKQIIISILADV
ncbi:hypothetical protein BDY19DRAFT_968820 [Irpex rosettiformis]|uniref:Uncharacterized protein n=1 Tax=Irpex rosettiformis TaxID=378272 RepID=A0ACB8TSK4_9APHY|nr:hypothetical protein BDY19DRAFT_968820 [Irpex rosettiformis]